MGHTRKAWCRQECGDQKSAKPVHGDSCFSRGNPRESVLLFFLVFCTQWQLGLETTGDGEKAVGQIEGFFLQMQCLEHCIFNLFIAPFLTNNGETTPRIQGDSPERAPRDHSRSPTRVLYAEASVGQL